MKIFNKHKPRRPDRITWREILNTTAYYRCGTIECTPEEYGYPGWIDDVAALAEKAPDKLAAIDLIEQALKEIEAPHVERRDYERVWEQEMCVPEGSFEAWLAHRDRGVIV